MAQPLMTPFCQFFDDNGDPLSGGKIYTYSAGTSTPKDTYSDSTGTVALANPVILDSAGRSSIWISGSYKITVKDSSDTLIRTVDNISSSTAVGDMTKAVYDAANIQEQLVGLTAVQTLTNKTLTKPNIGGTTTADDASAGNVGEYISSSVASGSAVSLTSGVGATVTSINLTAGDWDVWGSICYTANASTTGSAFNAAISATNNTLPGSPNGGAFTKITLAVSAGQEMPYMVTGSMRVNISSTTTYYLVAQASFAVSTMAAHGFIGARRRR